MSRPRYDFRQPQQVSRPHRDAAQQVLEGWAHWSATQLAADARQPVSLQLEEVAQHPYKTLADTWGTDSMVWTLLEGPTRSLLVVPRAMALRWFDWHIGGTGVVSETATDRELTEYEQRQWKHLLRPLLEGFRVPTSTQPCWRWRVGRIEFAVAHLAWVADADWVVAARFRVDAGGVSAPCWLVWSLADFALDAGTAFRQQAPATDAAASPAWLAWLDRVPVRITATIPGPRQSWRDLSRLQPDTLLLLPTQLHDAVTVHVQGVRKASGTLGQAQGHRAVRLDHSWLAPVTAPDAPVSADRQ